MLNIIEYAKLASFGMNILPFDIQSQKNLEIIQAGQSSLTLTLTSNLPIIFLQRCT